MIISQIADAAPNLRRSERKVADLVLRRPNLVTECSIADLAKRADVSEPTVIRFCRAVGCTGFQDLKRLLLKDLGRRTPVTHRPAAGEGESFGLRVYDRIAGDIARARAELDRAALDRAVELVSGASRIDIYALGEDAALARALAARLADAAAPARAYLARSRIAAAAATL
ncbi:MAG: MurR/RpiR family transcriptional regulator, partial [Caulobacterales bacterium]|nr:MurR/RpiR family transcriptional regulator [Caulobacterales bacterium]